MKRDEVLAGVGGAAKTAIARIPGIGEIIGGGEAYRSKQREKAAAEVINMLGQRIEALGGNFDPEWFNTPEGEMFANKTLESALDAQLADKRDLFVNALINGVRTDSPTYEKTKFVDMLRQLSRDALDLLACLHVRYGPMVAASGRPGGETPHVSMAQVVSEFTAELKSEPYRVESAYRELWALGLFSKNTRYVETKEGSFRSTGHYPAGESEAYTPFAERFVEFIDNPPAE